MTCSRCHKHKVRKGRRTCVSCIKKYHILKDARAWKKEYFNLEEYACRYCGKVFKTKDLTIDHKIPISRGGKDSRKNIHLVCGPCNRIKGDFTHKEFLGLMMCLKDNPVLQERLKKRLSHSSFLYVRR